MACVKKATILKVVTMTNEPRVPEVGDHVIVCSTAVSRTGISSGMITQWNREQNVFSVTDRNSLEEQQYVMTEYSFHFNEKGNTWFCDHYSHKLKVKR